MRVHFGQSTYTILAAATIMILMALGAARPAFASTNYPPYSPLNGCYAHRNTSVDTQLGARNRSEVGTTCFDGAGNVVYSTTGFESGSCSNTNGAVGCTAGTSISHGTYAITNYPGDGMGTVNYYQGSVLCQTNEISIDSVDSNGLAHGFEYTVLYRSGGTGCGNPNNLPKVMGGTAIYQGP